MIDISTVINLQTETVERWHLEPVENMFDESQSLLHTICQQHSFNFLLWHEEDIARSPDVSDAEIARVKRSIDRYNQQRNDWIEKIDDLIASLLEQHDIRPKADVPMNTETPGSTMDRLSILALRLYHLQEQLDRVDVDQAHLDSVQRKMAICRLQQDELSKALEQLIDDLIAGRKRHRIYRHFKMYNDPTLNPYLYQSVAP